MIKICHHKTFRSKPCYNKVNTTYLDPKNCKIYILCEEHLPPEYKELYEALDHSKLTKEEWTYIVRKKLGIFVP